MNAALPQKSYWPPAYIYLQSFLVALAVLYFSRGFYADDSYISLRYARNLMEGAGMTWNPGERVEGYSNFLYILFCAALGKLGIDLVLASRLVNIMAMFGLVWTLNRYCRDGEGNDRYYAYRVNSALCVGLTGSCVILLAWCMGGLEGPLCALFVGLGLTQALRPLRGWHTSRTSFIAGIALALATLTRYDAGLFFAYTALCYGLLWLRHRMPLREPLLLCAAFALIMLPYMGWRIWYFGELLPNTAYAKTYGIPFDTLWPRGVYYVLQFLYIPPLFCVFALVMFMAVRKAGRLNAPILFLAPLPLLFMGYIVTVGGDHMPYLRFMPPLVPVMTLLIYHLGLELIESREKLFRDISGSLLFFSVFQFGMVQTDIGLSRGALSGLAVAPYIAQNWPAGSLIAVNPAGALPYSVNQNRYIDMLGLVDKHIARRDIRPVMGKVRYRPIGHLKGDGAYVLSRKPDYIIYGDAWGDETPRFLSDVELAALPAFEKEYERVETYVTPPPELLDELRAMRDQNIAEENQTQKNGAPFVRGPVLDTQGKLRFIYYRRR